MECCYVIQRVLKQIGVKSVFNTTTKVSTKVQQTWSGWNYGHVHTSWCILIGVLYPGPSTQLVILYNSGYCFNKTPPMAGRNLNLFYLHVIQEITKVVSKKILSCNICPWRLTVQYAQYTFAKLLYMCEFICLL